MADQKRLSNVTIENAELVFRNFAGRKDKYNRDGDRNFCVFLPDDVADQMEDDGWNIKMLQGREEGDPDRPYLPVSVSFGNYPPQIVLLTGDQEEGTRTHLGENEVETLDQVDIINADLMIRPYRWEVNDKTGVKAYLKTIFVLIDDPLVMKYADWGQDPKAVDHE